MKRINIVGTSGSGKSTFARLLSAKLNYPYLEMDALYWQPNWREPSDQDFFSLLQQQLSADTWVLDGNYNRTVPVKWAGVDTVIWLDYSFSRTLFQALKRALIRCTTKQELWPETGNVESFRRSFFSKDSVVLWTLKSYKSNRKRYQSMFVDPQFQHIRFVHLSCPKMAEAFLEGVGGSKP